MLYLHKFLLLKFLLLVFHLVYEFYFHHNMGVFNSMVFKPLEYYFVLYILYKSIKKERDIKFFLFIFYVGVLIGLLFLSWQYVILGYDPYSPQMWDNPFAGHKNNFAVMMAILCLLSIQQVGLRE